MGSKRDREERLGSWAKDKRSRQAALSSLRKQIKKVSSKGGGTSDEKLRSASSSSVQLPSTGLVIHPEQTTDEGYTRLQEVRGESSSAGGSLADLREVESKDGNCSSACSIM